MTNLNNKDENIESLLEALEGVSNMLLGMTFDRNLSESMKEAMLDKLKEIDSIVEKLT